MIAVCGREEELQLSTDSWWKNGNDMPCHDLSVTGRVAGKECYVFRLGGRYERGGKLIARQRIAELLMMVVAEDEEVAGMSRPIGVHLVSVVGLNEFLAVFRKGDVTAFWCEFGWRSRSKADLAMPCVLILL
jgi:hypothetical protein